MKKIKCIHFDLDSVLYIYTGFIDKAFTECVKVMIKRGLKAEFTEAKQKLRQIRDAEPNSHAHFNDLCYYFNKRYDSVIIASAVEKYWEIKNQMLVPVPGAKKTLDTLRKQGYKLTIVSNGIPVKQAGKLVKLGLDKYFYDPVNNYNIFAAIGKGKEKPSSYLFNRAAKATGYSFRESIMVGDRLWSDIYGANRLGMKTVLVKQGPHAEETIEKVYQRRKHNINISRKKFYELCQPDVTIKDLRELPRIIN